ncbi:Hypothetical predicted protein [Cloeon dipterum]|nr:Hypothetical predicted protein [Cloeon dipterum]
MREAVAILDWKITIIVFSNVPVENAVTVNSLMQDDGSAFPSKVDIDPDNDTFAVANTSGSTGLPKGVVQTHKCAVALLTKRDCMPFFDHSVMTPMNNFPQGVYTVTTGTLAHGLRVVHLGKFEREQYFDHLMKYKPGTVVMYPFVATWFARHENLDKFDLSFLKVILCGGAIIDPATMALLVKKLPHVDVKQMYGMTECPGIINTGDEVGVKTAEVGGKEYVSPGTLTPYVSAKIVDLNTRETLGPYQIGEITVKSVIVMKGYLSKDSPTPIRTNIDSEGWLSTGDAGFFDDQSHLYLTERLSSVFKYIMYFVSPSEIESILQQHEKVLDVGVVGVPNPETTNLARAFVVKKGEVSEKELCDFVAAKLPVYKHLHVERIFESQRKANPNEVPNVPIYDYIYKKLCNTNMQSSTKPWVIDSRTGKEVRFCDIDPVSKKIGSALTRLGFKKGEYLHFATYETAQLYLVQLGIWRIGGVVRGCFQNESAEEFARQISESKTRFVLADEETLPRMREAVASLDWKITIIVFSNGPVENAVTVNSLMQDDGTSFPVKVDIDPDNDIFAVANTSGSTGLPKGVVQTHKCAVALLSKTNCMPFFDQQSVITPMNNFPIGVYMATIGSIANGCQVVHLGKYEREQYFDHLLKYKPGTAVMYPFIAIWFARHENLDKVDLSFLKVIICSGAMIDPTTMNILAKKLPHVEVKQLYGLTECFSIANTEDLPGVKTSVVEGKEYVSAGKLTPYVRAKIVDLNTREPLGPYQIGEITVKSIIVMKGYLSKDSPIPLRPNIDSEGWLSTGDAGFFDNDSNLYVTERLSFVFKYIMYFVSPSEIESILQQHDKVLEAGVVGVPNPETTNLARAFVVKKGEVSEKELCDFVAAKLPVYKHLHGGVRFVQNLPKGDSVAKMKHIFTAPDPADPDDIPNVPIYDFMHEKLCENKKQNSTEPWVVDSITGVEVRFCDIDPISKKIASALTRMGFKKGDFLHFVTFESAKLYLVQLAVWRLGGAVRGSFQMESADEFARQISESKARFALVDEETLPRMREAIEKVDWKIELIIFSNHAIEQATTVETLMQDDGTAFPSKIDIDVNSAMYVANTSGSTGLPKGVVQTYKSTVASICNPKHKYFFRETIMTPMNNFPVGVYTVTVGSIAYGCKVVHLGKFAREEFLDHLLKYKPGNVLIYPFIANWLARDERLDKVDLSFLKLLVCGGAIIDATTMGLLTKKLPAIRVTQIYGMSESTTLSSTEEQTEVRLKENEGEWWASTGKLTPFVKAMIVDLTTGESLGPNKKGEVKILSPMTMKGYLSKDSPTPIKPNIDSEGWLSTGDVGFFDEEGNLYITERLSFVFKYFMYFVSPTEIESVLQKHEKVVEAGVVGVPHPESTNLARAYVVKNGEVSDKDLIDFVAQRLPSYKHLHGGVRFVQKLPIGRAGKLDRAELKRMAIDEK